MADKMLGYAPEWTYDDSIPVREPIMKLGKMITDRIPIVLGIHKITKQDPEYWAVATICPTDEMAEIAMRMKKRNPRTLADMKKLTANMKLSDDLEKLLEQMSENGLIEWNYENPQHEKQWVLPMFVPGSGEFSNMNKELLDKHPELGRFFERMMRNPLEKVTPMVPPGGGGIGMHVIPVEKAIEMENEAIGIEKISHWLDKYDGKYAASPCSCRYSRQTYDEGCADDPEGW
ncbi:MAG: pyridine nucleotide-disulfide oxidoreductase, partial [Eubacterium sp.]|nr:pyridine nucleotide-disulfide oxidoreductase [Eubacterium sp.]